MLETIRKITLENGVRILLERIPHLRSASAGIWIDVGSRNETEPEGGLSHFIEHMLFKGTSTRNALEISHQMDLLGGSFNAFTSQENISLSAKVIDEHLPAALDLLAQMLLDSVFDPAEIERERNVILEEVKMYDDTPDEYVIDLFLNNLYEGNPLGRPILGEPANISRFSREDIRHYIGKEFSPNRVVVAVAGKFDEQQIESQLRHLFGSLGSPTTFPNPLLSAPPTFKSRNVNRKLAQVHFCMGTDGPSRTSEDRFAFAVLNTILGGGSSSRIFQEVREKRGLAYSIGSFDIAFRDTGCFAISGGTSPGTAQQVIRLCLEEVRKIYTSEISETELASAREQIKSATLLSMESSSSRMARLAETELYFGEYLPVDYSVGRINAVTRDDIRRAAETYLKERPVAFASIGPEKKFSPYLSGMAF